MSQKKKVSSQQSKTTSKLLPHELCNGTLNRDLDPMERESKIADIAEGVRLMLEGVGLTRWDEDHNTKGTPERIAKYWVDGVYRGRFSACPDITDFDNAQTYNQLINVGPIEVNSTCAHHGLPFLGYCWIGILPHPKQLIGLSKYPRLVDWFCGRPNMQEELTKQISEHIWTNLKPKALGVRIISQHMCARIRGVHEHQMLMDTTDIKGYMETDHSIKQEFLDFTKMTYAKVTW